MKLGLISLQYLKFFVTYFLLVLLPSSFCTCYKDIDWMDEKIDWDYFIVWWRSRIRNNEGMEKQDMNNNRVIYWTTNPINSFILTFRYLVMWHKINRTRTERKRENIARIFVIQCHPKNILCLQGLTGEGSQGHNNNLCFDGWFRIGRPFFLEGLTYKESTKAHHQVRLSKNLLQLCWKTIQDHPPVQPCIVNYLTIFLVQSVFLGNSLKDFLLKDLILLSCWLIKSNVWNTMSSKAALGNKFRKTKKWLTGRGHVKAFF